jgi:hypothetical protein
MFGKIGNLVTEGMNKIRSFDHVPVGGKDNDLLIKAAGVTAGIALGFFAFMVLGAKATVIVASLMVGGYALHKFINQEGFDLSCFWKWAATDESKKVAGEQKTVKRSQGE